jgi:hypothetical protein
MGSQYLISRFSEQNANTGYSQCDEAGLLEISDCGLGIADLGMDNHGMDRFPKIQIPKSIPFPYPITPLPLVINS